jgi:hypothetical protein
VYYVYEGRVRTDVFKDSVKGLDTKRVAELQRVANLNLWGVYVSPDGKTVGVSAGGGFDEQGTRRRHYAIPVYDTKDMKTMVGEISPHAKLAYHPVLPLAAAGEFSRVELVNTKSYASISKHPFPKRADTIGVLAFGGKGRKMIIGTVNGGVTTLQFTDLTLSKDDEAKVTKAFGK